MSYKITNKTFSPMILYKVGVLGARKSIVLPTVPKELRYMERNNKLNIKEIKEK